MGAKIFLTGFMGSGKTYWGKKWAAENGLDFFDLDEQIESTAEETIADIFKNKGEGFFRELERSCLRGFADKKNFILACGGGTPCFFENMQWMNANGATVYLRASPEEILERLTNGIRERPLLSRLNASELLSFIKQKLEEREPFYYQAAHVVDVNVLTAGSLSAILNR